MSVAQEPFPGGAARPGREGRGGQLPRAGPRNPSEDGGAATLLPRCSALRQLQATAQCGCCQPPLPLRFTCVGSASSWKQQLDRSQPEATCVAVPHCACFLPTCTGAASLCPGTGAYGKSNAINTRPCHHPLPRLSLHFTPATGSTCSLTSSVLFAVGSLCGNTRFNAKTITVHAPKKKRSCG